MRDRSEPLPASTDLLLNSPCSHTPGFTLGISAFRPRGATGHFPLPGVCHKRIAHVFRRYFFCRSQSLGTNPRRARKKGQSPVLRYLAEAHALQLCPRTHALCAHSHPRVPPCGRSLRRPHPGGDRKPPSGIRRRHLHHARRRSDAAACSRGWGFRTVFLHAGSASREWGRFVLLLAARSSLASTGRPPPSSMRATPSTDSSADPAISSPAPPPWPSPSSPPRPTTRSSSTAAWAWARRTSCTPSVMK